MNSEAYRPLQPIAAGVAALLLACGCADVMAEDATPAQDAPASLPAVTVTGAGTPETATTPVTGFVARQASSATKTDTPLIETPQAISVITRERIEAQGTQTVRDLMHYTAGASAGSFDSRRDTVRLRGGGVSQYLDGLLSLTGYDNIARIDPYTLERAEVLRGPSSVLYGLGSVGGVLNLVSKRPQPEPWHEVQLQAGSHQRKQAALDFTGPLSADGRWLYRLVAVGRDSNTQVRHVPDDRRVLMPSITWRPSADTQLTLRALHQRDKSGSLIGFFPWEGTGLPGRHGRIPTATFISEPGWDAFNTRRDAIGYEFSHRFSPQWTLRQNLRQTRGQADYRTLYTSFTADPVTNRPARPVFNADGRTVQRNYYQALAKSDLFQADTQLEGRLRTGAFAHTLLLGADWQRTRERQATARGVGTDIDVYAPVYGSFTPPTSLTPQPAVRQRQMGLYLQDQIKWGERWVFTAGLRHDQARSRTDGRPQSNANDRAWSKRAGLSYLADGGWAPYLSYTESFLPLGGINAYGQPYKPQRGKQWELGLKWQPEGERISGYAALYHQRDTQRKTPDPANPLNSLQIGEVTMRGLELETTLSLARHWDATLAYAYTDARVSRSNGPDLGQRVAGVPRHTASAWVSYRWAAQGRAGWVTALGVRHASGSPSGTPAIANPSWTLMDAMLAYEAGDWRMALTVTNLADKVQLTSCLARGDCFYGQRRTAVLTATYRF